MWNAGYKYIEQRPPHKTEPSLSPPRMKTHVKSEPFTNQNNVGYTEDPYEIREDSERLEYIKKFNKLH